MERVKISNLFTEVLIRSCLLGLLKERLGRLALRSVIGLFYTSSKHFSDLRVIFFELGYLFVEKTASGSRLFEVFDN